MFDPIAETRTMFPFFQRKKTDDEATGSSSAQSSLAQLPSAEGASAGERADLLWQQGSRLLERKRYVRAVQVMEQAFELEPSRLDGRLNLGAALYLAGRQAEAVPHLKYVLALEPQNTPALLNLAACYDALEMMDESIGVLSQPLATAIEARFPAR